MSTSFGVGARETAFTSALSAAQTAALDAVVALEKQLLRPAAPAFAKAAPAPRPAPAHEFLRPQMPLERAVELLKELASTLVQLAGISGGRGPASQRFRAQLAGGIGVGTDLRSLTGSSASAFAAASSSASSPVSSSTSSSASSSASSSPFSWDANPFKEKVRNDACRGSTNSPTNLQDSPQYALAILHTLNTQGGKVHGSELQAGQELSGVTNADGKPVTVDQNHIEGKAMDFDEMAQSFKDTYGIDAQAVTVKDANGVEMKALQLPNGKLFADARGDGLADKFDANLDGMAADIKQKFGVGIEEYTKAFDELKARGVEATPTEVFQYAKVKEEMKKAQEELDKQVAELNKKLSATLKQLGIDLPQDKPAEKAPAAAAAVKPPSAYERFDPAAWARALDGLPEEPRRLPQWLGDVAQKGSDARFTQGGGLDYFVSLALQAVVFATLQMVSPAKA